MYPNAQIIKVHTELTAGCLLVIDKPMFVESVVYPDSTAGCGGLESALFQMTKVTVVKVFVNQKQLPLPTCIETLRYRLAPV